MDKIFAILIAGLIILISPFSSKISAETKPEEKLKTKISLNGDVQFRFRYHYETGKDVLGNDLDAAGDYTNRYAWNFKLKAVPSENTLIGMRLSNPKGSATDNIEDNLQQVSTEPFKLLSIPEMYFKWNVGILSLAGGIIPVKGNTILGLAAFENNDYKNAVTSWNNYTNNSQMGVDLGLTFIDNKSTSLGFGAVSAMATDNVDTTVNTPSYALRNDQLRFIFTLPASLLEGKLSFLPCLHMRTNVYRSADKEKANHSLVGGIEMGVKPIKQFGFTAGFAVGGHKNNCLKNDSGYVETAPLGLLTVIKLTTKPGFGKGIVIFKMSNSKDRNNDPQVVNTMLRWDVKYGFPVKSLTIMPRMRVWYSFNNDKDDESQMTQLRPELIFMVKF